jgi:beta-mannosidase
LKKTLIFFLLFIQLVAQSQVLEKNLNTLVWQFKKQSEIKWHKATVPGTVHTDLFNNKLIPDPFYGTNEKQLHWIENENWEYKSILKISKQEFAQQHLELQFDGLDTYAKIYLNDSLILITDNMFRTWAIDIKKYAHIGNNQLKIIFESAVKRGKKEATKLQYSLPGDEKVFTRKAQYQYGWDWGPRFVTCGIYNDIKLVSWNEAKIISIKNIQKTLNDSIAELEFSCEIQSDVNANAYIDIIQSNTKDNSGQRTTKVALKKGIHSYSIHYTIKNPSRWWSNGLGFPFMYDFKISLSYNSVFLDSKYTSIGLRTIELIQDKDSIGSSFYFKLNGVPVFMKGANYIPSDNFLPHIKKENYQTVIKNAVDANMNMLRVWGGGVYADDEFYNQCDLNGILVWQDFMFACAMYPGDEHFMRNVAEEVIDQVERLRNHPSIALWCGNNEVNEGWKNWGWQKQHKYSTEDSTTIADNNTILFDYFIKDIVNTYDGTRAYWPSSPSIGWGHKESLEQGDSHYWGVWWGMEPFENYKTKTGRFVSEYGFQGMPNLTTLIKTGLFPKRTKKDILFEDQYVSDIYPHVIDSTILKAHQKHPTGYQTIKTYMERDYKVPQHRIEHFTYVSQLLQAEGMKTAIEAHRRAKPYCMGTLYWQLNDCWPVTSWSTIDYYNTFKASHYQVKHSYEDIIISIEEKKDSCNIFIISDLNYQPDYDYLTLELIDFSGKLLWTNSQIVKIDPNSSKSYFTFDKSILKQHDSKMIVLKCSIGQLEGHIYDIVNLHYFVKPKDLALTKGNVEIIENICEQRQCFSIKSDVLLKNVLISIEDETFNLSDNYFDLLPNEAKTIYLPKHYRTKNLKKKIKLVSLVDTY